MSYQVHNFKTGDIIEAAPANEMDAQIQLNETNISSAQQKTRTSNKTGSKMYLAGATSQATSATTYSNVNVYIGTDNCLYSNKQKVLTVNDVPTVTASDNGKFLRVVDGAWSAVEIANAQGESF